MTEQQQSSSDQSIVIEPEASAPKDTAATRRELLRLGAAGLPMVMTLNGSAASATVSQLQCFFRLPARVRIMVNANGNAWASTRLNVRFSRRRNAFRKDDLDAFLAAPDTIQFTGGVDTQYRPNSCTSQPTGNWVDCGWNKFSIGNNAKITPANYLTNNNTWSFSGNKGLYVDLSLQYASQSSTGGGWPGISCIVSILNYIGQN